VLSSPKAKMEAVLAAGRFTFKMHKQELEQLEKVFHSVGTRLDHRNKYAHGVYVVDLKKRLCVLYRKYDVGHEKHLQVLPLAELRTEAAQYVRVLAQVKDLEKSAWDMLPHETVVALTQIWQTRRALRPKGQG